MVTQKTRFKIKDKSKKTKVLLSFTFCLLSSSLLYNSFTFCQSYPHKKDTIKIGLLIQDKNSKAALQGAEIAIRKANLQENKRYFTLAVRDMEGPWGTGSRVAVDLVFNEKVRAIIGSVDGRNSHLAEMVSAKTRIPFLSAWSGDPSLAYAFIPWYFCCVPNDQQKAASIIDFIRLKNALPGTAVVTAKDYDSKTSSESFMKTAKEKGIPKLPLFSFDNKSRFDSISLAMKNLNITTIAFFGTISDLQELKKHNQSGNYNLFCVSYDDGESALKTNNIEGVSFISPGYLFSVKGKKFSQEFLKVYGSLPGDAAAYAYDMTNVVINSINVAAGDRDSLKNYLRKTDFEGVTGRISFDERGSRKEKVEIMTVRNGKFTREK